MLRFTNREREKLLFSIYQDAKKYVENIKFDEFGNIPSTEEKEKLIHQESDRLLALWMEDNKDKRRTDLDE